ncbi:N-acetylmuramoyl-L-alanine amidase family protein [Tumebacillus lipolyticus]|uniref:N-acetylmuramoyl-L-alanine amidase n=1 Tax=Tumebacillus lipolyticus TaxID=1280370 RepID=A0ABW4ZV40_9BACL
MTEKKRWHVVLDPGHGGSDHGFGTETLVEKDVNLAVCSRLKTILEASGVDVLMTRTADVDVEPIKRAELAHAMEADLFVSWHCDYLEDEVVSGVSLWVGDHVEERYMIEFDAIGDAIVEATKQIMLGVFQDHDNVLSLLHVPAVMIRGAFLSNEEDHELCKSPNFLQAQAQGTARGILKVLHRLSLIE